MPRAKEGVVVVRTSLVGFRIIGGLLMILALGASVIYFRDYITTRPDPSWPIVHGEVISRSMIRVGGIARRPYLRIRVVPSGPIVHAILATNAMQDIPDNVSFRYSGDPTKEVELLEETSSLAGALMFLGIAGSVPIAWSWYIRRQRARTTTQTS